MLVRSKACCRTGPEHLTINKRARTISVLSFKCTFLRDREVSSWLSPWPPYSVSIARLCPLPSAQWSSLTQASLIVCQVSTVHAADFMCWHSPGMRKTLCTKVTSLFAWMAYHVLSWTSVTTEMLISSTTSAPYHRRLWSGTRGHAFPLRRSLASDGLDNYGVTLIHLPLQFGTLLLDSLSGGPFALLFQG